MEESNALKCTTDSEEGGKIAYVISKHFRATRAYEAVQGLFDLFKNTLTKMMTFKISTQDGTKLF